MFKGRSKHNLDAKGRLAIPARFKEVLQGKSDNCLVLTNHFNCLWAFTREEWQVHEEKADRMSDLDPKAISYIRYFISGAQECPLKQGRITIPPDLREIAGLKKEVVLVGLMKKFEIWDREKWEEEFRKDQREFLENSRQLHEELGI